MNQVSANDVAKVTGVSSTVEEPQLSVLGDNMVKKASVNINGFQEGNFSTEDGLYAMLENGPCYARAMIDLQADEELKDSIVMAMSKLVSERLICALYVLSMSGNLSGVQLARQATKGVPVGSKQDEVSRQEVSDSNPFDVLNSIENDDDLGDTENPCQQKEHNTNVLVSTDHTEPIVTLADGSQPATVDSYPDNGEGSNRDKNMEEMIHMVHDTTLEVTGSFNIDADKQTLDENMNSHLPNENTISALFGAPLSSIKDIDVLTRKIEAGDYEDVMTGITSVERKAVMEAIEVVWKKLLADLTGTSNVPINVGTSPRIDTPIVKSTSFTNPVSYVGAAEASSLKPSTCKANIHHLVSDNVFDGVQLSILMNVVQMTSSRFENTLYSYFICKQIAFLVVEYFFDSIKGLKDVLESGPWMICNSPMILKKLTMNTSPCKEELTRIPVWVKIHDVPLQVFLEDGISLIASQIVKVNEALKDSITMGIPLPQGMGFTKETVRVEYECKLPRCEECKILGHVNDQCAKNATTIPTVVMNNDGFQMVVNKRKSSKTGSTIVKTVWQPIKPTVRFDPKSNENSQNANDGLNIVHSFSKENPTKAANIPSFSYTRGSAKKGGIQYPICAFNIHTSNPYDALDDMESDEEVEVVFDKLLIC
ncbi:zinc knuckle CX2CX4HX4C containing protein [Tanacetum coccineum]